MIALPTGKILTRVAAAAAVAATGTGIGLGVTHSGARPAVPTTKTFLQLTNQYRAQHHRGKLTINAKVQKAAVANTKYMVRTKKLRSDPAVNRHFGTACALASSMVSNGPADAKRIMKTIEGNASTRKVLLGPYTKAGIAPITSHGETWVTLDFVGGC